METSQRLTTPSREEIRPMNEEDKKAPIYVVVEDPYGMQVMIPAATLTSAYAVRKYMGGKGFTNPADVPAGGYSFPYAAHENFDWDMIGARPGEVEDSETKGQMNKGVWFKNQFYRRRDAEETAENARIKMGARIWYSRGARDNDEPHLIEGQTGKNKGYIPLVSFRGNKRRTPQEYLKRS